MESEAPIATGWFLFPRPENPGTLAMRSLIETLEVESDSDVEWSGENPGWGGEKGRRKRQEKEVKPSKTPKPFADWCLAEPHGRTGQKRKRPKTKCIARKKTETPVDG